MRPLRGGSTLLLTLLAIGIASAQTLYWEKQTTLRGPMTESDPICFRDSQSNTYLGGLAEAQLYVEKVSPSGTVVWRYLEQDTNFYDATAVCITANFSGDCFAGGQYHPCGPGKGITGFLECIDAHGS